MTQSLEKKTYDGIDMAVAHDEYRKLDSSSVRELGKELHVLYDVKRLFSVELSDRKL